jgi:hypothetical protein
MARIGEYIGQDVRFPDFEAGARFVQEVSSSFGPHSEDEWRKLAGDGRADYAVLAALGARQRIEIVGHTGHAVHADEHARVGGVAPLLVGHAVQAGRRTALHAFQPEFAHGFPLFLVVS